jgi:hypothetical protein
LGCFNEEFVGDERINEESDSGQASIVGFQEFSGGFLA